MVLHDACSRLFSMGMESVLALLFKKRFRNFRPASQPAQPFRTENAAKWRQFARQTRVHGIDLGMYGVRQKDGTKNIWDERASRPASQPAIPDEVSRNEKKNFALKVPESQKILKSQKGPAHKARTGLQWPSGRKLAAPLMKRQFRKLTRTPTGPVTCTRGVGTFFCNRAHVFSGPAQRLHGHCVSFQRSTLPGQLVSRLDLHSRGSESLAECLKKCKPRATKNGEISVSHLFAKHRTRFCPSETHTNTLGLVRAKTRQNDFRG